MVDRGRVWGGALSHRRERAKGENLFKDRLGHPENSTHLKGQCSSLILDFLKFFFSTQSLCHHQGSISLFCTDLVLGLLTKVIDASRSKNVSKKLRILETFSVTFEVIRFY